MNSNDQLELKFSLKHNIAKQLSDTTNALNFSTVRGKLFTVFLMFYFIILALDGILRFPSQSAEDPLYYFPFPIPLISKITIGNKG